MELRIPPLFLVATVAAAIILVSVFVPAANVHWPGHRVLAVCAFVLGPVLAGLGVFQFRRARTTVSPLRPARTQAIVRTGVYRWSRNPMYLGMALALLGLAAWWSSVPGYLAVPAFVAYLTRFQIVPEERALLAKFGPAFGDYTLQVRRWL
jgi:protein-S-isoprenylcysteine O-methyltransferase Ste14